MTMSLQNVPKKAVGILGGGITGLATAYYLKKRCEAINPVIFEKSPRLGGCVKTIYKSSDPNERFQYECGPRTIRPHGLSGMNTLDLLEELELDKQVLYVTNDHPSAENRFIYTKGKMTKLPTDNKMVYKTFPPFERPLMYAGLRDLFTRRKIMKDDSIYNFVCRRFGEDIANYVIDPMIRGICAGDARQISVKFLMKQPFDFEQKNGSVILGYILNQLRERKNPTPLTPDEQGVGFSNIAISSFTEKWSVWTLENGLQSLVDKFEDNLVDQKVTILKNCDIEKLEFSKDRANIQYLVEGKRQQLECSHIINTIPAHASAHLFRSSHEGLAQYLDRIQSIDVDVTNLMFNENVIPDMYEGFGFLVPSTEESVTGLLGIVFDTCTFPQGDKTILTVMSYPQSNAVKAIKKYLQTTLKLTRAPDDFHNQTLFKCIPQYSLGHYDRVEAIRNLIAREAFPLSMAGASFDGVSVNDCIFSGKKAADSFINLFQQ